MRTGLVTAMFLAALAIPALAGGRSWLAGDHHVHSRFSGDYPPGAKIGDVSAYAVGTSAQSDQKAPASLR